MVSCDSYRTGCGKYQDAVNTLGCEVSEGRWLGHTALTDSSGDRVSGPWGASLRPLLSEDTATLARVLLRGMETSLPTLERKG